MTDWANRVSSSQLDRSDLDLAVKTTLYPSITFGLMATCLTKEQCEKVFAPIKEKIVPKMKICRNTSLEVDVKIAMQFSVKKNYKLLLALYYILEPSHSLYKAFTFMLLIISKAYQLS